MQADSQVSPRIDDESSLIKRRSRVLFNIGQEKTLLSLLFSELIQYLLRTTKLSVMSIQSGAFQQYHAFQVGVQKSKNGSCPGRRTVLLKAMKVFYAF